jgi:catechol-2,3-dioxygenase
MRLLNAWPRLGRRLPKEELKVGMHIGHLALRVAQVDAYAAHITQALGLTVLELDDSRALLGSQGTRHELQLIASDTPAFDHVGLMVETAQEFEAAVERAVGAGGTLTCDHAEEEGCELSSYIIGPGGIRHQLYLPSKRPPLTLARNLSTAIRRFGHLTFLSSESDAIVQFWREGLGFRVSDEAPPGFTWLRCDTYHHSLAVGPHPAATILHHHAWETQDITALTKHCDVNALAGRPQLWGPVRHGPGFNFATYMPDAAGAVIEVYADLLMIEDDENYVPIDWSNEPLALNLWGTMPSPEVFAAGVPVLPTTVSAEAGRAGV